jgi:Mrp family chromosome partitioning ATPase
VDVVIVDSPALMEVGDAAAMAAQVAALVMIVDLDKAHHSTLVEMRHLLAPLPCKKLGAILVKTKGRSSRYGYYD